jgi:hypothetical protein
MTPDLAKQVDKAFAAMPRPPVRRWLDEQKKRKQS